MPSLLRHQLTLEIAELQVKVRLKQPALQPATQETQTKEASATQPSLQQSP